MLPSIFNSVFLSSFFFISSAFGEPTPSTQAVCKAIEASLPAYIAYPGSPTYKAENSDYWSKALSELLPACIVRPTTAEGVSSIVKILNQFPDVKFVVKSGGHSPNKGDASIQDGVLIALSQLRGVRNDPSKGLAYVKPGGRWSDVIGPLNQAGVTMVGGRLGIVGVGGYLVQGGLSFLSAQYGMASDNIVNFQTVVANGSIVDVNERTDPDLLVAMRGSGGMFGIVTEFTAKTYPIGKVWGGYRLYSSSNKDILMAGLHEFIQNPTDPKAAIIWNIETVAGQPVHIVFYFYDGAAPASGAFGKLTDVKALADFTKTRTYPELLDFNAKANDLNVLSKRTSFRSITLPLLPGNTKFYSEIMDSYKNITSSFFGSRLSTIGTMAFQPLPPLIGKASEARGGNAMGLKANDLPRFIIEINFLWNSKADDEKIASLGRDITSSIQKRLAVNKANIKASGVGAEMEEYTPYFMNDATQDQDVIGSYKMSQKMREMQKEMDPNGLFKSRAGGFR